MHLSFLPVCPVGQAGFGYLSSTSLVMANVPLSILS